MNDDRTWKFILLAAGLVLGAIVYSHFVRERPPHEAIRNVAPDGTEMVTPLLKDQYQSPKSVAASLPPPRVNDSDRENSEKAWLQGNYKVVPSAAGILALENGFESRVFLTSEYDVGPCKSKRGATCLLGPGLEAKLSPDLPERFLRKGSNPDSRRRAPTDFGTRKADRVGARTGTSPLKAPGAPSPKVLGTMAVKPVTAPAAPATGAVKAMPVRPQAPTGPVAPTGR